MKGKNVLVAGLIGLGVWGLITRMNQDSITRGGGGEGSGPTLLTTPENNSNPLSDIIGLLNDFNQPISTPPLQEESIITTKKIDSGYQTVASNTPVPNIFSPTPLSNPERFAFNPSTGGIIDTATQQSITPQEYVSKNDPRNPLSPTSFMAYAQATTGLTKKETQSVYKNPNITQNNYYPGAI